MIDVNEALYLKKLRQLLDSDGGKGCGITLYYEEMKMGKTHFLSTLGKLEKMKLIEFAFFSRSKPVKVVNWKNIAFADPRLKVSITKKGNGVLTEWE